jgi:hypothetical protein
MFDMSRESDAGVTLYSRKIMIMSRADNVLPRWLRFVKGMFTWLCSHKIIIMFAAFNVVGVSTITHYMIVSLIIGILYNF